MRRSIGIAFPRLIKSASERLDAQLGNSDSARALTTDNQPPPEIFLSSFSSSSSFLASLFLTTLSCRHSSTSLHWRHPTPAPCLPSNPPSLAEQTTSSFRSSGHVLRGCCVNALTFLQCLKRSLSFSLSLTLISTEKGWVEGRRRTSPQFLFLMAYCTLGICGVRTSVSLRGFLKEISAHLSYFPSKKKTKIRFFKSNSRELKTK